MLGSVRLKTILFDERSARWHRWEPRVYSDAPAWTDVLPRQHLCWAHQPFRGCLAEYLFGVVCSSPP